MEASQIPRWIPLAYPTFNEDRRGYRTCVFWLTGDVVVTLFSGRTIIIPKGFTTDGASVPGFLTWLFPRIGDHLLADLIHDYLYSTSMVPKAEADLEFYRWMCYLRPLPKSALDNLLRYLAVSWFGRGAYARKGHL